MATCLGTCEEDPGEEEEEGRFLARLSDQEMAAKASPPRLLPIFRLIVPRDIFWPRSSDRCHGHYYMAAGLMIAW